MRSFVRPATLAALAALAVSLTACKGKDVAIVRPGDDLDSGTGEDSLDDGVGGRDGGPLVDAAPQIPDALPFDALPVTEPGAPSAPLLAEIRDFEGRFALYAQNLVTGGAVTHGAEEWLSAAPFMRLWPVVLYAELVSRGQLDPAQTVPFTADFYRGGGDDDLTPTDYGKPYELSRLANLTLLSANPSAEELLLSVIGGSPAVNTLIDSMGIEGMGHYLGPCEMDHAFYHRLDPRFDDISCPKLAVFVRNEDARGLVPAPFDAAPTYTDQQLGDAWQASMDAHDNAATAHGIGETLARLHGKALPDTAGSIAARELLDHALGSGGGGNNLPDPVWVSNIQGPVFKGRVWAALVRGGDAPMVLVLMSDRETGRGAVGARFDRSGQLAYEQIVGPIDLTRPAAAVDLPAWLGGIFVHEPDESSHCNSEHSNDYAGLVACRRDAQRTVFHVSESTAATVMVSDGPDVEATWLWTEPDGTRHRYQVKLGAGGWWAWTRSFQATIVGPWRLDVWLNAQPFKLGDFTVVE